MIPLGYFSSISLWIGTILIFGGCIVEADHGNTVFTCETSSVCPSGQACADGVCVVPCTATSCPGDTVCVGLLCVRNDAGVDFVGNEILTYSFDDYIRTAIIHDRSPNRLDGFIGLITTDQIVGKYGLALEFDGVGTPSSIGLQIPYNPVFYTGNTITIEAYVVREESDTVTVYGDYIPNVGVEYSFGIQDDNRLEFVSSDGCSTIISFQSTGTVQTGVWQHIAVTWDGQDIRFYINGAESGSFPSTAMPCPFESPYMIGARGDINERFVGSIDEVKVSDFAKTAVQITESMGYDSTADIGVCGDKLLENEICLAGRECCSNSCQATPDLACGEGLCSSRGACIITNSTRVSDDLLVFYDFNESLGTVVSDTSGVKPAIDLNISDEKAVIRNKGSLEIVSPVTLLSSTSTSRIVSAINKNSEFSAEAWVLPANSTQTSPARIFTMSEDGLVRNFTLGQSAESYVARITSGLSSINGLPEIDTPRGDVDLGDPTHLLVTRASNGLRRFYVNGVLRAESAVGGSFETWAEFPIAIANEVTGGRRWLGEIYLVALYGRDLTPEEVARNFSAGFD